MALIRTPRSHSSYAVWASDRSREHANAKLCRAKQAWQMSKDVVRTGYDAVAAEYLAARHLDANQSSFLEDFARHVQRGARVLDAGCGAGIPVTRWLSERFAVTGVDISEEQIRRARELIPEAAFIRQDMTALDFPDQSFDAICSFYAVIHIPREEHRPVLENFHRMLKPGGILLLCTGAGDTPGDIDEFFGVPMYWSHYDAETNLRMTEDAGFAILRSELVPDRLGPQDELGLQNNSNHLFLLAEKREHSAR